MDRTSGRSMEEEIRANLAAVRAARMEYARRPTIGERFVVPREGKRGVNTILYRPSQSTGEGRLPVLFNMHGGAWIGGDAVFMESFCRKMADELPAFVVNVNYTKADEEPILYAVEEVADAVRYFAAHADEYGIDPDRMAVGGHSAGGQLAAGAALKLKDEGTRLACQVLVYPCTDLRVHEDSPQEFVAMVKLLFPNGGNEHRYISPLSAADEELTGLCPAIFILCGNDWLKPMGIAYAKRLIDNAVPVKVKEYPDAVHGFLEVNRSDFPAGDERQTPEQAAYARDCEQYLIRELRACFAKG